MILLLRALSCGTMLIACMHARTQCSGVNFTFQQNSCLPTTVQFSAVVSNVQSFTWDFGNGQQNSSTLTPSVNYGAFGSYVVKLTVLFTNGCVDSSIKMIPLNVQPDPLLVVNADTTICQGSSLVLQGSGTGSVCWRANGTVFNTSSASVTVTPAVTTLYAFTSHVQGANLVANGSFTQGNAGFSSDYIYQFPNIIEGRYWVGTSPVSWNPNFVDNCPGRLSATDNMMMVNGSTSASGNVKVWYQTVSVQPNTNYMFSCWLQSLHYASPASLQFYINGVPLGNVFHANSTTCVWDQFYNVWNSGSNTTATIEIINMNDALFGNDFALDDIFFGSISTRNDSVTVTVLPSSSLNAGNDISLCKGASAQLSVQSSGPVTWTPSLYLSDPTVASPQCINPASSITYVVQSGSGGCAAKDSVTVFIYEQPQVQVQPVPPVCKGTEVHLQAQAQHAVNYQWYPVTGLSSAFVQNPVANPQVSTTYTVVATNGSCADTSTVTVLVKEAPAISVVKSNDIDCGRSSATLVASGSGPFSWSPYYQLQGDTGSAQVIVSPDRTQTYYVASTGANGCTSMDSVTVRYLKAGVQDVFIPNAFTPNGDMRNETFRVHVRGVPEEFEFRIFNRWGELIFLSRDPAKGWNGYFREILQPNGVYVYWLRIRGDCGDGFIKGSFVLIK